MNNEQEFITIKQATKIFGIPPQTFRRWDKANKLKSSRTPTNIRIYRISDIEKAIGIPVNQEPLVRKKYVYCRVSSSKQKLDLGRQVESLKELYPTYDFIEDIGSGINFNRKGLQTLLVQSMSGELEEVVVAHKDRLARFGFDLIKFIFEQNNTRLIVLDESKDKSDEQELSEDLLAIVQVFACKQMGRRRYGSKNKKNEDLSNQGTESGIE